MRTAPLIPSQWSLLTLALGPCWVCSKLAWRKFGATALQDQCHAHVSPASPPSGLAFQGPGQPSVLTLSINTYPTCIHPMTLLCLVRVLLAKSSECFPSLLLNNTVMTMMYFVHIDVYSIWVSSCSGQWELIILFWRWGNLGTERIHHLLINGGKSWSQNSGPECFTGVGGLFSPLYYCWFHGFPCISTGDCGKKERVFEGQQHLLVLFYQVHKVKVCSVHFQGHPSHLWHSYTLAKPPLWLASKAVGKAATWMQL